MAVTAHGGGLVDEAAVGEQIVQRRIVIGRRRRHAVRSAPSTSITTFQDTTEKSPSSREFCKLLPKRRKIHSSARIMHADPWTRTHST